MGGSDKLHNFELSAFIHMKYRHNVHEHCNILILKATAKCT